MKIVHVVNTFAAAIFVLAISSVSIAIWGARQSEVHLDRISLAHSSYEQHLRLTADTFLLFKRFGDLLLVPDNGQFQDVDAIIARMQSHLDGIRDTIEAEILLVGEEELEELELLDDVEDVIEDLIASFQAARTNEDLGDARTNWRELSVALNNNLKNDFNELIAFALEEEREEVEETEAEALAEMALVRGISSGLAVIVVIVTLLAVFKFRKAFTLPLASLMTGVRGFAQGDFSRGIELRGSTELTEISKVLDEMASKVSNRTTSLTQQNEELEEAVRQRTQSLEKLLAEARKSEEARRQLLADVSHELRTPLTVIQGESDIALRGGDKTVEEYKEALQRARTAANHTANLVSDLLFMSRTESGSLRLKIEPVHLGTLVSEVIEISGKGTPVHGIPDDLTIEADGHRIKQALLALLENAKHHGGDNVEVNVSKADGAINISVSDDGKGMTPEEREMAFERFFRGNNAADRYVEGLGLGLPIVQSIAEAHGGTARITEGDPGGTVVTLTIPETQRHR